MGMKNEGVLTQVFILTEFNTVLPHGQESRYIHEIIWSHLEFHDELNHEKPVLFFSFPR